MITKGNHIVRVDVHDRAVQLEVARQLEANFTTEPRLAPDDRA